MTRQISRLRLADLANLWAEGPNMPSHIALLAEFDASPFVGAGGRFHPEQVRAELALRTWRVPALTRRVLWTHPGEGRPVWVTDPAFDPAHHIDCAHLASGADLADWCADRVVWPLDRERPLWRAEIIEGLPNRRFGLLVVVHHAVADGLAGLAILAALLDTELDTPIPNPAGGPVPPVPTRRALICDNLRTRRDALAATVRRARRLPPTLRRSVRQLRDAAGDVHATAPATSLPRRVSAGRRLAVVRVPLGAMHAAAHARGATVNDLLLAAVAGGMRELLRARGDEVDGLVLRASFPVGELPGQSAGMLLVGLPIGEPDPLRRLCAIATATTRMKTRLRTGGGDVFDVLHLPAVVARLAVRWMRRAAHRHINLFVTNVPGPRRRLWLAGACLLDAVPVAPLTADVPIGVAALSYADTLAISINADAAITDLHVLAHGIERGFSELRQLTTTWPDSS